MKHQTDIHCRRSLRLKDYDYAQAGAYFVSVCTHNRACVFGDIVDGGMVLNNAGQLVAAEWIKTAEIRNTIALDAWVVMPNHVHGILLINDGRGTARRAPTMERFGQPVSGSIPTIIRSFKSAVTKRINESRNSPGVKIWQRNYYEHIIRTEDELSRIREYITNNPIKWEYDRENPNAGTRTGVVSEPSLQYGNEPWRI